MQLEQVIADIDTLGLELDDIEIADALWLAQHIRFNETNESDNIEESFKSSQNDEKRTPNSHIDSSKKVEKETDDTGTVDDDFENETDSTNSLSTDSNDNQSNSTTTSHKESLPFNTPQKRDIFITDELLKALLPLKIKYTSKKKEFDEAKTVEFIADTDLIKPIFSTKKEPYFGLYLLIDTSSSMEIWQESIEEFIVKLRRFKIFNSIEIIYLDANTDETKLYKDKAKTQTKNIQSFKRQNLAFVLSDAIASAWRSSDTLDTIKAIGHQTPTIFINMLPYRMWDGTILANTNITHLSSNRFHTLNREYSSQIDKRLLKIDKDYFKKDILKLPTINLTTNDFRAMSYFILNTNSNDLSGIVTHNPKPKMALKGLDTPLDIVQNFYDNASTIAFDLAQYLSVVKQMNIAIMQIVQSTMLPESTQTHLAEVFVGGLLQKEGEYYRFKDGVDDILLEELGNIRVYETLYQIGNAIACEIGSTLDFKAFITFSSKGGELNKNDKVFAFLSMKSLEKLGGRYAQIVSDIEQIQDDKIDNKSKYSEEALRTIRIIEEKYSLYWSDKEVLHKIVDLDLSNKFIIDLSPLKEFINLESLFLAKNAIIDISILQNLTKLITLDLRRNKITQIISLKVLNNLKVVYLDNNRIQILPQELLALDIDIKLYNDWNGGIVLDKNPIVIPPLKIVSKGNKAIQKYFDDLENKVETDNQDNKKEKIRKAFLIRGGDRINSGDYPLRYLDNSIDKLSETLHKYGDWDVESFTLESSDDIATRLKNIEDYKENEILIFYVGHGVVKSNNYYSLTGENNKESLLDNIIAPIFNFVFTNFTLIVDASSSNMALRSIKPNDNFEVVAYEYKQFESSSFVYYFIEAIKQNTLKKGADITMEYICDYFNQNNEIKQKPLRVPPLQTEYTKIISIAKSKKLDTIHPPQNHFQMGSNDGNDDEKHIHKVTFDYSFEIGKYPVTFDEYDLYCESIKAKKPSDNEWGRGRRPAINVSWEDANLYCIWLNEKLKIKDNPFRLPTEAEWEYACRAGTTTMWSFGDSEKELGSYAWYNGNSKGKTHIVGEKDPNPWGLYDMHGNVREWCKDDWIENYNNTPRNGNAYEDESKTYKKENSANRVLRGGSWASNIIVTQSSNRFFYDPTSSKIFWGFRLIRTLPITPQPITITTQVILPEMVRIIHQENNLTNYSQEAQRMIKIIEEKYNINWNNKEELTKLSRMDLRNNQIKDISPIKELTNIIYLDLSRNHISDTSLLKDLKSIKELNLSYNQINNISHLDRLTYLTKLYLNNNNITDISMLGKLTNLTRLILSNNLIKIFPKELLELNIDIKLKFDWKEGIILKNNPLVEPPIEVITQGNEAIKKYFNPHYIEPNMQYISYDNGEDFEIGIYSVTFYEYDLFCQDMRNEKLDDNGWGRGKQPVVHINWQDAVDYCEWLSEKTNKIYRLPKVAQWEYACKAGTNTKWYFGDDELKLDLYAWYNKNSDNQTHPVGEKLPNSWGLYDMHGNVWEWCDNNASHNLKMSCGGSYRDSQKYIFSSSKMSYIPDYPYIPLGFRLLRVLNKNKKRNQFFGDQSRASIGQNSLMENFHKKYKEQVIKSISNTIFDSIGGNYAEYSDEKIYLETLSFPSDIVIKKIDIVEKYKYRILITCSMEAYLTTYKKDTILYFENAEFCKINVSMIIIVKFDSKGSLIDFKKETIEQIDFINKSTTYEYNQNYSDKIYYELGKKCEQKNEYNKAIEAYNKVVNNNLNNQSIDYSEVYFRISSIYELQNKLSLAIKALNQAIEINPKNSEYKYKLSLLKKEDTTLSYIDNANDNNEEIWFKCKKCLTHYEINCDELEWEIVSSVEKKMSAELMHEAIYEEECDKCENEMSITFNCWEYPIGIETHRDVSSEGVADIKGDCCPNLIDDTDEKLIIKDVETMVKWFYENYEDPANSLPYNSREGGYQTIHGELEELDEVLFNNFDGQYSSFSIKEAISRVESENGDMSWSPIPEDEDDFQERLGNWAKRKAEEDE